MPILRGRDAVQMIREMGYRGIIIGVTANVLQMDIEDFIAQGADYVIKKPMNTEKFRMVLSDINRDEMTLEKSPSVLRAGGVFSGRRRKSIL